MLNDLFKPVIPKAKPVAKPPPPKKKDIYSDDRDDGKEKGSTFAGCRLPSPACGARGARPPLVFARSPRPAPCRCSGRVGPGPAGEGGQGEARQAEGSPHHQHCTPRAAMCRVLFSPSSPFVPPPQNVRPVPATAVSHVCRPTPPLDLQALSRRCRKEPLRLVLDLPQRWRELQVPPRSATGCVGQRGRSAGCRRRGVVVGDSAAGRHARASARETLPSPWSPPLCCVALSDRSRLCSQARQEEDGRGGGPNLAGGAD